MRSIICAIMTLLLVVGCETGAKSRVITYRAGLTPGQVEREVLECKVDALREAPVVAEREHSWILDGFLGPADDEDANESLRNRLLGRCLDRKNVKAAVSIPECDEQTRTSTRVPQSIVYPKLTERSCYVLVQDGSIRILTPK